ncbi:hypothetical protein BDR04DRAFT_975480, partial [Suillus decipiens]
VINMHPESSTYTLDLPNSPNIFPTFHASQLHCYHENGIVLFPSQEHPQPGPIVTEDSQLENFIKRIIDECKVSCRKQYLMCW